MTADTARKAAPLGSMRYHSPIAVLEELTSASEASTSATPATGMATTWLTRSMARRGASWTSTAARTAAPGTSGARTAAASVTEVSQERGVAASEVAEDPLVEGGCHQD